MGDEFLHVEDLRLSLDGSPLLRGVSLSVSRGELCYLIGPNGAGKSTLLKCLDRLHDSWTGHIRIGGHDIVGLSRRALSRLVGYVPQFKDSLPDFTVEEFLHLSRYAWSPGQGSGIVEQSLRRVGMVAFRHRSMTTLSGGECQKVFIAAGLVQETPLLLLDEPTAFLDPGFQHEVNALLHALSHEDGVTILCVSHDLNSSLLYGDRLVGVKSGQLAFNLMEDELQGAQKVETMETLFDTTFAHVPHPERLQTCMLLPMAPVE